MTTRNRPQFKFVLADVYDSFGMSEQRVLSMNDLRAIGKSRKVVVLEEDDSYARLTLHLNGVYE